MQVSQSVKLLVRAVALVALGVWLGFTYVHHGQFEVMLASVALIVMSANDVAAIIRQRRQQPTEIPAKELTPVEEYTVKNRDRAKKAKPKIVE
jgi:hypothetical protein